MDNHNERFERAAASVGFLATDLPETSATSAESAVQFLIDRLVTGGMLGAENKDAAVRAVLARERLGSTAIGGGIAIPHAAVPFVSRVVGVLARSKSEVQWDSVDGRPVHRVCLLLAPEQHPGDALRALEQLNQSIKRL